MTYRKFYREQKYIDGKPTGEYRNSGILYDLDEYGSASDCNSGKETQFRKNVTELCEGDNLMRYVRRQRSYDGVTWTDTDDIEFITVQTDCPLCKDYSFYKQFLGENIVNHPYYNDYFTVEALEDGNFAVLANNQVYRNMQYSKNDADWNTIGDGTPVYMKKGDKLRLKKNASSNYSVNDYSIFSSMPKCKIYGNINSMCAGDDFKVMSKGKNYFFKEWFYNNNYVVDASNLVIPYETLEYSMCQEMFYGCTNLEYPPLVIPGENADYFCCESMFQGCIRLKVTPYFGVRKCINSGCFMSLFSGCISLYYAHEDAFSQLELLSRSCFAYAFQNCINLRVAPELPATELDDGCYSYMFNCCSSIVKAPKLPATELKRECYEYMFYKCVSLKDAPELPSVKLDYSCYKYMFGYCKSIENAPELPALSLRGDCYYGMFSNCVKLKKIPSLPCTWPLWKINEDDYYWQNASGCYSHMFENCKEITEAYIPLQFLYYNDTIRRDEFWICISYMFFGCSKLNYVKTDILEGFGLRRGSLNADFNTQNWLQYVSPTGTFVKKKEANWTYASHEVPEGWTIIDEE